MEQKKLKEQNVNKFYLIFISLLIFNCSQNKSLLSNDDYKILDIYIKEEVKKKEKDSIFIELNNSSDYILNAQKKYFKLKNNSFYKIPSKVSKKINGEIKFVEVVKGDSIYNSLLKKPWTRIILDSIVHRVFSDIETLNYEQQLSNNNWNEKIYEEIESIYQPNSKSINPIHISKPLYTSDNKFALIYSYSKKTSVSPTIKIYKNKKGEWQKIHTINPDYF